MGHAERVSGWFARACTGLAALLVAAGAKAACPGAPRTVHGTVYCDNRFTLWVNGEEVVDDPVDFTPHQAVRVSFEWDGVSSLTYAIQCEDYASESGYEYVHPDVDAALEDLLGKR